MSRSPYNRCLKAKDGIIYLHYHLLSMLVPQIFFSNSISHYTHSSLWCTLQLPISCTLQAAIDHECLNASEGVIYLCYHLLSVLVPQVIQSVTTLTHHSDTSYNFLQVAPYRLQLTTRICMMNMVQSAVTTVPYIHWYHRSCFITLLANYLTHHSGTSYNSLQVSPYRLQLTTSICMMNMVKSTVTTIPHIHQYHR